MTYISSCQEQPWEYFAGEIILITGLKEVNDLKKKKKFNEVKK